jgi:hypothetical protein
MSRGKLIMKNRMTCAAAVTYGFFQLKISSTAFTIWIPSVQGPVFASSVVIYMTPHPVV